MNSLRRSLALVAATIIAYPGSPLAADDVNNAETVARDLTAVIALQGLPCGQVVSANSQGENDYIASCADGHRYRVSVNAEGRVVVDKVD